MLSTSLQWLHLYFQHLVCVTAIQRVCLPLFLELTHLELMHLSDGLLSMVMKGILLLLPTYLFFNVFILSSGTAFLPLLFLYLF